MNLDSKYNIIDGIFLCPYIIIENKTFTNSNFEKISLYGSKFNNVKFIDCNMTEMSFSGSSFDNVNFVGCNMTLTNLNSSSFNDVLFDNVNLSDTNLSTITFNNVSSINVSGKPTIFSTTYKEKESDDFSYFRGYMTTSFYNIINGYIFGKNVNLSGVVFDNIDFSQHMTKCERYIGDGYNRCEYPYILQSCNFDKCIFNKCNLYNCDFSYSSFVNAKINGIMDVKDRGYIRNNNYNQSIIPTHFFRCDMSNIEISNIHFNSIKFEIRNSNLDHCKIDNIKTFLEIDNRDFN